MIFGMHALTAYLQTYAQKVQGLWVQEGREQEAKYQALIAQVQQAGASVTLVTRQQIDAWLPGCTHQGIVAACRAQAPLTEADLETWLLAQRQPWILVLDGVTDPHNLGACLRTAEAAGVQAVIVPKDKSAPVNMTVRKVACGAAELVPVFRVTNLARTLRLLKQFHLQIIGTAGEAEQDIYARTLVPVQQGLALVMGAEGKGMRRLTREECDLLVKLPMCGQVSSLNVSVATGVCLYELVRQRQLLQASH
nr:23S rRNA (guanosine(2251)-2'-O)-methyltransferase RlmB [Allopseudospirillum japonicum]